MTPLRRPGRVLAVAIAVVASASACRRHLIMNLTASVPRGLYWLERGSALKPGALAVFPAPEEVLELVRSRRYLPLGVGLLLKPIVGHQGDFVCTRSGRLLVGGADFGAITAFDSAGRELPIWDFCGRIPPGYFVAAAAAERSFDSRHFGLVADSSAIGSATPLFLFDRKP